MRYSDEWRIVHSDVSFDLWSSMENQQGDHKPQLHTRQLILSAGPSVLSPARSESAVKDQSFIRIQPLSLKQNRVGSPSPLLVETGAACVTE
jgi:hypothetical protein